MKSIVILAAQNIRVDTHDVVAGDVLAELRSDHPLLTLTQMVQMGQATIQQAAEVNLEPGTMYRLPAGWDLQSNKPDGEPDGDPPVVIDLNAKADLTLPQERPAAPDPQEAGEGLSEQAADSLAAETADATIVLSRPLADFPELDPKLREYLAAATPPITTLREATDYLAANGGHFRALADIGTAADKKIKAALGL